MSNTSSLPSTSTTGFFQSLPVLEPSYTKTGALGPDIPHPCDDAILARLVRLYVPAISQESVSRSLHDVSRLALQPSTLSHSVDAETNVPTLHPLTTFGEENRDDPLRTSAGWKALKSIGHEQGVISRGYEKHNNTYNRRVEQFAVSHVWSPAATLTMCPFSMTDGAAFLLARHLDDEDGNQPGRRQVVRETYRRLISRVPGEAWTSGQWMTERSGGSDVSGTETLARMLTRDELASEDKLGRNQDAHGQPLGPWRIDGFKWFSSATDSDMTVLLAKTSKGISAFYLPMRRRRFPSGSRAPNSASQYTTELNGVRIQRLKEKMGTKGLPTAELELKGARGWLIGEEGKGVKEIAAILTITRIHTALGSASYWARGLAIARAYSKVRKARGRFLYQHPQHVFWMARETVQYWAATQFGFFGAALLGCNEQNWGVITQGTPAKTLIPSDGAARAALLRLLTPVMKCQISMSAVSGLRATMECLGGVGYCENNEDGGVLNVARLFRDSVVNTIWEGTVSVMAEDVRRVLGDQRIGEGKVIETVFGPWAHSVLRPCRQNFEQECATVDERLQALISLVRVANHDELEYRGRDILDHLEAIASATILLHDANSDGNEIAAHIASRYAFSKALPTTQARQQKKQWQKEAEIDAQIFLGTDFSTSVVRVGKL